MVLAESSGSRPSRCASFDTSAPAKEWLLIEGEYFANRFYIAAFGALAAVDDPPINMISV
jgi:hypothetical protein